MANYYFENILEAAAKRKSELKEILKLFYEKSENIKKIELKELPPKDHRAPVHAAEDGGHRLIDFEAYSIYLIKAGALCISSTSAENREIPVEKTIADVNVIIPPRYAEERVSLYREILELWISRRVLWVCKPNMFLWDGSLRPLLIKHRPGARYSRRYTKLIQGISKRISFLSSLDDIASLITSRLDKAPLVSLRMVREALKITEINNNDAEWISFLEWLEKLLLISMFLKDAWELGAIPVFITKTSRETILFDNALPDIYYLRQLKPFEPFRTPGKLRKNLIGVMGLPTEDVKKLGPLLPSIDLLKEVFLKKLGLIEFYARLERAAPLLKIEIAIDLSKQSLVNSELIDEIIANVLKKLLSIPILGGYPLSLRLSHSKWKITNKELDKVLRTLGLDIERGGREMLK